MVTVPAMIDPHCRIVRVTLKKQWVYNPNTSIKMLDGALHELAKLGWAFHENTRVFTRESPQSLGGKARAKALSPERRSEIAQNAAKTRWKEDIAE